jgi:hypothetical protein
MIIVLLKFRLSHYVKPLDPGLEIAGIARVRGESCVPTIKPGLEVDFGAPLYGPHEEDRKSVV